MSSVYIHHYLHRSVLVTRTEPAAFFLSEVPSILKTSLYIDIEASGLYFHALEREILVGRARHGLDDNNYNESQINRMGGLDWFYLAKVVDGNEPSDSIKFCEFLEWMSDCVLSKNICLKMDL
jgi:hypothetical protein